MQIRIPGYVLFEANVLRKLHKPHTVLYGRQVRTNMLDPVARQPDGMVCFPDGRRLWLGNSCVITL